MATPEQAAKRDIPLKLVPVTADLVPQLVRLNVESTMAQNNGDRGVHSDISNEAEFKHSVDDHTRRLTTEKQAFRIGVLEDGAVDDVDGVTPKLVATAKWRLENKDELKTSEPDGSSTGGRAEAMQAVFNATEEARHRIMGRDKAYYNLSRFFILPGYEYSGVVPMMMNWGFERADEEGRESYAIAAPQLKPVYERFGWVAKERTEVDLSEFGLKKSEHWAMFRAPKKE